LGTSGICVFFPGGSRDSDDGKVSIYLMSRPGGNIISGGIRSIEFQSRFIVGLVIHASQSRNGGSLGVSNFAKRSTLIRALDEGALVIEVLMKKHEQIVPPMPFTPENPFCKIMLKKCMDATCSDAAFEVGDERVVIHAQGFILKDGAPTIFELCASDSDSTAIPIMDVQPEIFRHLLRYVYGGSIPTEHLKEHAKDIINAADKYEVVNLKLEAEAMLVFSTSITIDNVVELLLCFHGNSLWTFQVHVHTLVSWFGAPLIHFGCSKVDSFYYATQVGDGSGGSLNVLISSGRAVMALPWPLQPLIFTFFIVVAAIGMICYHLALFLVPGAILLAIMTTFQLKKKEKQV